MPTVLSCARSLNTYRTLLLQRDRINVPHAWTDAAVTTLANAWAAGLRPDLNLTIE